ncbi:hypothetical protein [Thermodesulfobacterium sp. TA1]|uniref:hypothetical protein n=1 Tax=Thermodesulfobacterium sp. TA1 TaxID=2234087 RepID=UPI00143D7F97|nr:hypothetical protein [Thermodesulfobacterium sp. TA1]
MVASLMLNNQNYQKEGEATIKKNKTLTAQPIKEFLNKKTMQTVFIPKIYFSCLPTS